MSHIVSQPERASGTQSEPVEVSLPTELLAGGKLAVSQRRSPAEMIDDIDDLQSLIAEETRLETLSIGDQHAPIPEHPEVWPLPVRAECSVQTQPCLVCNYASARPLYAIEGIEERLVTCDRCGLGSLHPLPTSERIADFYPAEYYGTPEAKCEPLVEAVVRHGARSRVKSMLAGVKPGARVLDIGCGRGFLSRGLLDQGFEAHGVEMSAAAAAGADPRAQIRVAPHLQDARYETNQFSVVILWHVLEHLRHPEETLAEVARILEPGGRLIIAVPNFGSMQSRWAGADWFHLDLPRHLYHFSDGTLVRFVERQGFAMRSLRHFALLQNPFGWLQSVLNRVTGTPRNSLYSLLHRRDDESHCRQLSRTQRALLRAAYWFGLPVAGLLSVLEALRREGGTVAMVAELPCKADSTPAAKPSQFEPALA